MGVPKIDVKFAGKTFLEWIAHIFKEAGIEKSLLVLRYDPGGLPQNFQILINPHPDRGILSSLQTAIPFLPPKTPFFMQLVDHPLVSGDTYIKMAQVFDGMKIVIPVFIGRKGHPVLFPSEAKDIIMNTKDIDGLRGAIRKWPGGVQLLDVEDEAILWNINSKEDLTLYENRIKANESKMPKL